MSFGGLAGGSLWRSALNRRQPAQKTKRKAATIQPSQAPVAITPLVPSAPPPMPVEEPLPVFRPEMITRPRLQAPTMFDRLGGAPYG